MGIPEAVLSPEITQSLEPTQSPVGPSTAYLGEFDKHAASGSGTLEDAEGGRYHGQFKNNKPHGFGTYVTQDGAVYQGAVHEACNLGALWGAPIVYAIENNHYAVATSRKQGCSAPQLCQVAAAYGMPGFQVDGGDPVAVRDAFRHVLRRSCLPCVIEIDTYRHYHHAGCIAGSACDPNDWQCIGAACWQPMAACYADND